MDIHVVTLFPDFFDSPLRTGILGRSIAEGRVTVRFVALRAFGLGAHRSVDDTPYGGGPGMVIRPEPLVRALETIPGRPRRILLSPQGSLLVQEKVRSLAGEPAIALVCGRYEGVDERTRHFVDEEISVGDYVLSGGEAAALTLIDAVARLLPGALGNAASPADESFAEGLLEHPQYTRPEEFRGLRVPDVLLSGNHQAIARWRRSESLRRTRERRPDLWTRRRRSPPEGLPDEGPDGQQ